MEEYLRGLRDAGVRDIRGAVVAASGHFAPNENPDDVAAPLRDFIGLGS